MPGCSGWMRPPSLRTCRLAAVAGSSRAPCRYTSESTRIFGLDGKRTPLSSSTIWRLTDGGVEVEDDQPLPGFARFYARDPFGNRIEFLRPDQ
jgi:catechol 2,3-dioxygenase-like lactoylglutathione lyase family enzyme